MANFGGFSWKRLLGISKIKSNFGRTIGIPTTRSGRQRKMGAACGCCLVQIFFVLLIVAAIIILL